MTDYSDYIVFADESGDHCLQPIDTDYPVFVLSLCVFHKDEYIRHLTPAIRTLKIQTFGHDLIILHESDVRRKKKAFARMSKESRAQFLEKLSNVIDESNFSIIAVVVHEQELDQRGYTSQNPYHVALIHGLLRLHRILRDLSQTNHRTIVVFESRGRREDDELELEFRRICDDLPMMVDLVFADKCVNCEGLQIADLTARPIGLAVIRPNQVNRAYEVIRRKLSQESDSLSSSEGITIVSTVPFAM